MNKGLIEQVALDLEASFVAVDVKHMRTFIATESARVVYKDLAQILLNLDREGPKAKSYPANIARFTNEIRDLFIFKSPTRLPENINLQAKVEFLEKTLSKLEELVDVFSFEVSTNFVVGGEEGQVPRKLNIARKELEDVKLIFQKTKEAKISNVRKKREELFFPIAKLIDFFSEIAYCFDFKTSPVHGAQFNALNSEGSAKINVERLIANILCAFKLESSFSEKSVKEYYKSFKGLD